MSSCPGEATLRLLGADTLSDETYASIEQHVEGCPECKAVLERLAHRHHDSTIVLPGPERFPRIPGFEIQSELDRGAMGIVYLAMESGLDRPVALKVLSGALGSDASSNSRRHWLREARAVSRIRHPNIVPLYDYGEADGRFFLVLEYVPGRSLKQRLGEPLSPRTAAGLMETIARAVGYIHGRGLFHLDLKPSNILMDGEVGAPWDAVTPRIADFGLAVSDGGHDISETSLACPRGTPSYMAPEQASANRVQIGAASDIYALGAILYELLSGRPPFQGTSTVQTLDQVRTQEPVPLRRLNPAIPRDLETICLKCLQKDPKQRYSPAVALGDDLRRWLDGKPISARPVSPLERTWRWCRRRPVIAALAAALTLVLSISFLIVVLLWRHAEEQRRRAEDDLHFAGLMLSEISQVGPAGSAQFLVLPRDNIIAVLQRTRKHLLHLQIQRPEDLTTCHQLAQLNLSLATHFELQGKSDECRSSLVECLENSDRVLQFHPQDLKVLHRRFLAYRMLGSVADKQGKSEESLGHLERAIEQGEECLRLDRGPEVLAPLAECRWSLAQSLSHQGDEEKARSLILTNRCMLDDVPSDDRTPIIAIWRTLVRLDLHQFKAGSPSAPASQSEKDDPLSWLAASDLDALDAESWAALVARCLNLGAVEISNYYLYLYIDHLSERMAWQRRLGRMDEARRSAARLHAFADRLLAQYPARSVGHVALCISFTQMAKNAWKIDDRDAVERNWKLAMGEARRALVLDPQDARANSEVADLQNRLDLLLASKPAPRD